MYATLKSFLRESRAIKPNPRRENPFKEFSVKEDMGYIIVTFTESKNIVTFDRKLNCINISDSTVVERWSLAGDIQHIMEDLPSTLYKLEISTKRFKLASLLLEDYLNSVYKEKDERKKEELYLAYKDFRENAYKNAKYVYRTIGIDKERLKAKKIVKKLKNNGIVGNIKKYEIFRMCRGTGVKKPEDIDEALEILQEEGYIRIKEEIKENKVGRPSDKIIELNPYFFK